MEMCVGDECYVPWISKIFKTEVRGSINTGYVFGQDDNETEEIQAVLSQLHSEERCMEWR